MTMSMRKVKLDEIMEFLLEWKDYTHSTCKQMQSINGMLQFVSKVPPPVRLFINQMLECLRDTCKILALIASGTRCLYY